MAPVSSTTVTSPIKPLIIIHGGAGNVTPQNVPPARYAAFKHSLLTALHTSSALLSRPGATAIDVATHAVAMLEDDPLFNAGKGAVFTRAGTNELESSIMVTQGKRKRGVGCMMLRRTRNPIRLAREMLLRGEEDGGGGAGAHSQLSGEELERLAEKWGLEMVEPAYFFTQRRWDEHVRGLERERMGRKRGGTKPTPIPLVEKGDEKDPHWDGKEYLPQGTVGAIVLDSFGTVCVATSTGGLTNKLTGRIGDTPTLGAGFWAEAWEEECYYGRTDMVYQHAPTSEFSGNLDSSPHHHTGLLASCFSIGSSGQLPISKSSTSRGNSSEKPKLILHAIGLSGTGNGDSFLRTAACRTAGAICRFSTPSLSLSEAVRRIAGPGGELQESAGDRWGSTGEGEGGIIGIELIGNKGKVVWNLNCGGMFRAYFNGAGQGVFAAFRNEEARP